MPGATQMIQPYAGATHLAEMHIAMSTLRALVTSVAQSDDPSKSPPNTSLAAQDVQLLLYLAIQYAQYAQGQHVSHYDISPSSEADEPNPSSGRPGSHSTSTSSSCILGAAIGPRPCCVGCVIS